MQLTFTSTHAINSHFIARIENYILFFILDCQKSPYFHSTYPGIIHNTLWRPIIAPSHSSFAILITDFYPEFYTICSQKYKFMNYFSTMFLIKFNNTNQIFDRQSYSATTKSITLKNKPKTLLFLFYTQQELLQVCCLQSGYFSKLP